MRTRAEELTRRADAAAQAKEYSRARRGYEAALEVSPGFIPARLGAAEAAWQLGRRDEARTIYKALVDELPEGLVPPIARARAAP